MKVGQRVRHQTKGKSFGTGTIVRLKTGKTVDVRWDTHRIAVPYGNYGNDVSGVYISSLIPISDK